MIQPQSDLQGEETEETTEMLLQCFGSAAEVVARYSHCHFCGGNLHFVHYTDFTKNLTQEIARCPECALKARRMVHKLQ